MLCASFYLCHKTDCHVTIEWHEMKLERCLFDSADYHHTIDLYDASQNDLSDMKEMSPSESPMIIEKHGRHAEILALSAFRHYDDNSIFLLSNIKGFIFEAYFEITMIMFNIENGKYTLFIS